MNIKHKIFFLYLLLSLTLVSCGTTPPATTGRDASQPGLTVDSDPAAVVQNFYAAYNDGDIEAAMAFVADDVQCRGHCYLNGKDAYRAFVQEGMEAGDQIEISDLRVTDDKVVFNYVIERSGTVSARGVDAVMQIRDGLIVLFEIN
jgi:hypothetical protein